MIVQLKTKGMTRLASRVSVFKWKTWKARTLETCCVTLKYCLYLYLLPLLFIHTKTIYKYSYFLHICIYIYIYYIYYIYIYLYVYIHIYVSVYLIYDNRYGGFLYTAILKWMFYVGAFLSIYSTPHFKIHPTAMA